MKRRALYALIVMLMITPIYAQYDGAINLSTANATFTGQQAGDQFGHHVAIVPDLNGDGYDELLLTAPLEDLGEESMDNGRVYLFYGSADGWSGNVDLATADATFYGTYAGNEAAHDAFGIGDIDNDGFNDLAIAIKKTKPEQGGNRLGKVYIFFGSGTKLQGDISLEIADASIVGDMVGSESMHIKGVGDLDDDGYDDIIIGAGFNSQVGPEAGKVFVFFGRDRNLWPVDANIETFSDASFLAENPGDWAGHRVSGLGDVNGDGYTDFLIGANHVKNGDLNLAGAVYLILGKARNKWKKDVSLEKADASWIGDSNKMQLGWNVAQVGDVDNDGLDDILFSSERSNYYLILANQLVDSTNQPISMTAATRLGHNTNINDEIGHDISTLGDLNDDGFDDFIIGNSLVNDSTGTSYLFMGRADWPATLAMNDAKATFLGETTGDHSGFSVSGSGDVNNNGQHDILISAYKNDDAGIDAGKAYLFMNIDPNQPVIQVLAPNGGEILPEGTSFPIRWSSQNVDENVKIEYSVDNGLTWDVISPDAENDGEYEWLVPDRASTQSLVRVAATPSTQIYDISDAAFEMAGSDYPRYRVEAESTTFDGGYVAEDRTGSSGGQVARIESGSIGTLTYVSDLPVGVYDLYVRYADEIDGTSTSTYKVNNNEVKEWQWDLAVSSDIYVYHRVGSRTLNPGDEILLYTLRDNGEYGRVDYFEFVATEEAPELITIVQPNGGETWVVGSEHTIQWTSQNTSGNIAIELTRDAGASWEPLADNIEDTGALRWTVSGPATENSWMRVLDSDGFPVDTSDAAFTIAEPPQPVITVTAPNGGETWEIDTTQDITWTSENTSGQVKVELSRDAGTSWETLASQTTDDGSLSWKVTGPASEQSWVRISDVASAVADTSDSAFTIFEVPEPVITVTSPNGGEVWDIGTEQEITWTSENVSGNVAIEVSRDAGDTWEELTSETANTGSFPWQVTGPASNTCLVKVSTTDDSVADFSDNIFAIEEPPMISMIAPNGGEVWEIGSRQDIQWSSRNTSGSVNIELSRDLGNNWETLAASIPDTAHYLWTVTVPVSDSCLIKVSDASLDVQDQSDAAFAIVEAPEPLITVTAPNGGELWDMGSEQSITWFSQDIESNITIELTRDNASTWETLAENIANSGEFPWSVTGPASDSARVRIFAVDGSASDSSDVVFTIQEPLQPMLTITRPNGGEEWEIGFQTEIRWTSQDVDSPVDISLSRDGGDTFETLASAVENTGTFSWSISGPASDSCRVKIQATDGSAEDISDAFFRIIDTPTLTIESPDGGEAWQLAQEVSFEWTSTNTSGFVSIQLTRNNGVDWVTLADSVRDTGSFTWTVTGPASNNCLALISDVDGVPIDISNATFKIVDEPSLTLLAPNGGEEWLVGSDASISWSAENISGSITIELSRDAGASWSMLSDNAPSADGWTWNVSAPTSEQCLIRISAQDGAVSDVSDAAFAIEFPTGVARMSDEIPTEFALQQNYPNPFNPETRITYQLPERSDVTLSVYNIQGNVVATLVNQTHAAGTYMMTWNGKDEAGHQMPSGVYFYRITADGFNETKRMMLMK